MKKLLVLLLIFCLSSVLNYSQKSRNEDRCFECHETLGTKEAELFKKDIHRTKGISCSDCHGGDNSAEDMETAMDPKRGFIGVPRGNLISEKCSNCHSNSNKMNNFGAKLSTNQFEQLKSSVHWKLDIKGKEHIVQCITCHSAHGIVSVTNPSSPVHPLNIPRTCAKCHSNEVFMRNYNPRLPVDQLQKYKTSRHGILNSKGDPKVAECVSCHGSHNILSVKDVNSKVYPLNVPRTCAKCHSNSEYMKKYGIPTDQFEKFSKSVHGKALLDKKDISAPACNSCHGNHGATPPEVESISKVCGTCHALNAELFANSPHKKAFDEHNYPECETCHGNHEILAPTIKMLGVTKDAVCSKCHSENENTKGYRIAKKMREMLQKLETEEKNAIKLVEEAEEKGMEIGEAKFKLRDIRQARLESKTMIHSFDIDKLKEIAEGKGLSTAKIVSEDAKAAIDDYYFRRYGLIISILIINLLAFTIYRYIVLIEKKK